MIAKGICVKLEDGDKIRKLLFKKNQVRRNLKIKKDEKFIYIPVEKIPKELQSYKVEDIEFEKINAKPRSYKDIISISDNLKNELPTSYDIVGDIILIKLKEELLNYKKEIGEALLKVNKKIKTVCLIEPVKGELRIRDLEIIAGIKKTKTIHHEYGLKFELDVSKTYFSPRLSTERKRVASFVKPNEIVVDMFTGVAPFPIMIAKYANPKIIYAIDKNKNAVSYAKKNIFLNNLFDKIEILCIDSKKVKYILDKRKQKADRIIMNLPFSSFSYFKHALQIISYVCVIHYYEILNEEKIEERIDELKKIANQNNILISITNIRKIKTYAPREFYIGIDITAKHKPM